MSMFVYVRACSTLRAVYTSCLDMQVSDLYVLDLYDFYVYMACLNLCPVWFYFPPYTLLQNSSFAIIIINEGVSIIWTC